MATINTTNGGLAACQEALVLLRQDKDLPKSGGALDVDSSDVVAKKVDRVYDSTRALIIGAHGWDGLTLTQGDNENVKDWPKQIRAAFVALLARELALPVTGRQEDLKAMHELYTMKLAEAIKKDFEEAVGKETDKLALAVYAVCKGYLKEGEPLPWSWAAFKARVGNAKEAAVIEVNSAHGWSTEFTGTATDWRYPAYERLVTAKMAASVGAGVDQQNLLLQAYKAELNDAARKDWSEGVRNETDPFARLVFGEVQVYLDAKSAEDVSYRRMKESFDAVKDGARIEVLSERDWNFARRSADVMAAEDGLGKWRAALPHDCLKIHDVEGHDGRSVARDGWWIEDGFLNCRGDIPIRITYTADLKSVERWDPTVKRVYVALMMLKLAVNAPDARLKVQVMDANYREALRNAALKDAKETQPGRVSWGDNDYANAIRGCGRTQFGRRDFRRGGHVR